MNHEDYKVMVSRWLDWVESGNYAEQDPEILVNLIQDYLISKGLLNGMSGGELFDYHKKRVDFLESYFNGLTKSV